MKSKVRFKDLTCISRVAPVADTVLSEPWYPDIIYFSVIING